MTRLKIYIAGPYTASDPESVEANVQRAIDAGIEVYRRGHFPYIPHLTHWVEQRSVLTVAGLRWEDYLTWDRTWLTACDALLHLASSRGADLELSWARAEGMQVFLRLRDVPVVGPHDIRPESLGLSEVVETPTGERPEVRRAVQ